jgi:hypothetical protein
VGSLAFARKGKLPDGRVLDGLAQCQVSYLASIELMGEVMGKVDWMVEVIAL